MRISTALLRAGARKNADARLQLAALTAEKNNAYKERAQVLALYCRLATVHGLRVERKRTPIEGWDPAYTNCVFVWFPTDVAVRQASWHYHDSLAYLFDFLPESAEENPWDGHTTEQKYEAMLEAFAFEMRRRKAWDNYSHGSATDYLRKAAADALTRFHEFMHTLDPDELYSEPVGELALRLHEEVSEAHQVAAIPVPPEFPGVMVIGAGVGKCVVRLKT